jgi:hypothetical protein
MYILAIAILCIFALLLAAIARARHARSRHPVAAQSRPDFAHHLFAAAKAQDSRTPHRLPQQNVKDVIARTSCDHILEPTLANTRNQFISPKRF